MPFVTEYHKVLWSLYPLPGYYASIKRAGSLEHQSYIASSANPCHAMRSFPEMERVLSVRAKRNRTMHYTPEEKLK